jgi:biopolymer transport protein ExbD
MGMNVQSGSSEDDVMSNINTTPLVDVMLVLLIIFLITVPVFSQAIKMDLPNVANQPLVTKPENIVIAVDKDGGVFWGVESITGDVLLDRLKQKAVLVPQPEVHIRADREARYEFVGQVVVKCQRAGIQKVGFISLPEGGVAGEAAREAAAASGA